MLASREPEAVLHLAVGGSSLNDLEQSILQDLRNLVGELNLQDKVQFGSFVPDDQLADYYRAADLFVLSSRYEPFGMTAIEAMACGTPTVVTVHGRLYRALTFGRHALFADPLDKEDLGITMLKAFRYPRLWTRMGKMGSHKARSLFTWSGIAHQLIAAVEHQEAVESGIGESDWDHPWQEAE